EARGGQEVVDGGHPLATAGSDAMPTSVGPYPTDAANGNATAAYFCRADNAVRAGRKPSRV
ncbi:MAG: hypothetical protein KDC40_16750, partial [Actinobacteria bacterium]|nr:hypothetical protein [Actinomycetota bacterium]